MPKDLFLWIGLALSFPFCVYAWMPAIRPLYRLIGEKGDFFVREVKIWPIAPLKPGELGVRTTLLLLQSDSGLSANYTYRHLSREEGIQGIHEGEKVTLFFIPWLTKKIGWSPQTVYSSDRRLASSIGIYLPFWFLGGVPFISIGYSLIYGKNLIFEIVHLIASI